MSTREHLFRRLPAYLGSLDVDSGQLSEPEDEEDGWEDDLWDDEAEDELVDGDEDDADLDPDEREFLSESVASGDEDDE